MELALGTVQFGMVYGVADDGAPPDAEELAAILRAARTAGVRILDTAPVYGDCERRLGEVPGGLREFRVVTKVPHASDAGTIDTIFRGSLAALRIGKVAGLLIHDPRDALSRDAGAVIGAMRALKDDGLVEKIGLSVYEPAELERFAYLDDTDMVQLPLNVLDQRMVRSGWVERLAARAIEVHARSAFLQGLLVMDPDRAPRARAQLRRFHAARREIGLTAPQACLAYLAGIPAVSAAVVGVKTVDQFAEVARALDTTWDADFVSFAVDDPSIVDPRRWS